jgi:hypothetical protein
MRAPRGLTIKNRVRLIGVVAGIVRGHGSSDTNSVRRDIAAICSTDVEDDGIRYDYSSLDVEPVRAQDEYSGVRVVFDARLGTIRERLQVGIGFGDAVWPQAEEMEYPVALGDPAPLIRAYRPETVIAEKLEAIVSLGIRNSRIKDFFDIDYLARTERFDRPALVEAIRRTFHRDCPDRAAASSRGSTGRR